MIKISRMDTLGKRIAHYRKAAKMSQAGLAKACGWSSQSRVGNYESGTREPTLADLEKIALAVGVSVATLSYGDPGSAERPGEKEDLIRLFEDQIFSANARAMLALLLRNYDGDPSGFEAECGFSVDDAKSWLHRGVPTDKKSCMESLIQKYDFSLLDELLALEPDEQEENGQEGELPSKTSVEPSRPAKEVPAADLGAPRRCEFEIDIPQYDVRAAMGAGQVPPEYVELVRHVIVDKRHLDLFGVSYSAPGNLAMITGWGQSMADTINHGEPVIVDRGVDRFIGDGIYVFTWDGLIYLKRLQKEPPARLKVISDNRNHDPFYIPSSEAIIHARVVMVWNARKV